MYDYDTEKYLEPLKINFGHGFKETIQDHGVFCRYTKRE
jgi:hypothetical protein